MDWVGYVAATCTTIAFLPQVIHTIRHKDTKGISLNMYLILVAGLVLWLAYGIYKNDTPIIAANAVTLVFSSIILFMKIRDELRNN
jgi:MtN3 and saliva related transmembrane protein